MPLKFCANISMMFSAETPNLLARFKLARETGFKAVELGFPYQHSEDEVAKALNDEGLQQVLINADPGKTVGLAGLKGLEADFKSSLKKSISYCNALKCKRLHIMAGRTGFGYEGCLSTYKSNLKLAVPLLEKNDIIGLIEPISIFPDYFLQSFKIAEEIVQEINSPHLRLQLDFFHLQRLSGNLTSHLEQFLPIVGHIQVAQVPRRDEPNSPGEINYKYIFQCLEKSGYDGWIGLEYNPAGGTKVGVENWIKDHEIEL